MTNPAVDLVTARLSALVPVPRVWTLAELLADPLLMQPPRFIIPRLVEAGAVSLLIGRPKEGKSTLACQLAADLSAGRAALDGTTMDQGTVLWFAIDEPMRRFVPRAENMGADPKRFHVVARDGDPLTPARIAALLEEVNPSLVVIDTLSQLASDNGIKPNDAESVVPFMKALVSAIQSRPNCGALLIFHAPHHANRAAGSLQWSATVDAMFVLRRRAAKIPKAGESPDDDAETPEGEDGRRILEGISRWDGNQRLQLTYAGGRYALGTGEAPLIDRVRWMLDTTEPGPRLTSRNAIAKAVHARDTAVADVLRTLIDRGEAQYSGNGPAQHVVPTASLRLYLTGGSAEPMPPDREKVREALPPTAPATASRTHTRIPEVGRQYDDGPPLDLIAADGPPPDLEDAA
jgi:hypothetical protein